MHLHYHVQESVYKVPVFGHNKRTETQHNKRGGVMSKTIKQFVARGSDGHKHYAGDFFEVEAETLDEAQEILLEDGFKGYLYEETYQWISTTPHYIDSKLSEYSKVLYQIKETGRGDYILESVVPTSFAGHAVNYVFRGRLEDCENVRDQLVGLTSQSQNKTGNKIQEQK